MDELGIEPGRPLRELERAILRQEPALELAPVTGEPEVVEGMVRTSAGRGPVPAQERGPFVGRDRELEYLRGALNKALAGHGRLVMLVGEPGIGKTQTAVELGRYAAERGACVLWGTLL